MELGTETAGLEWLIHSFPPAPPYFNGLPEISEPL